jgi:type IV pilus assembly protein PilW
MERRRQAGFTLMELMVSLVLASIATGFAFSIYARASQSSRAQARVAETQQSLRAATELMAKELRAAGFLAGEINVNDSIAEPLEGIAFRPTDNENGDGPDAFSIVYAESTLSPVLSRVSAPAALGTDTTSTVDNVAGWAVGDLALATKVGSFTSPVRGKGCLLKITQVGADSLEHSIGGAGAPWNVASNSQCDKLAPTWGAGDTLFTKVVTRKYRIKPNDVRGVLEMSPSGGFIADDWQEIGLGIIDLQLAVYVYTDPDGSGAAPGSYGWYSGANMSTVLDPVAPAIVQPVKVRLSLLAKSLAPTSTTTLDKTPDFVNTTGGMTLDTNDLGNHYGTALPVSDPTSPYHGDNLYRWTTVMVDLRNLGIGR